MEEGKEMTKTFIYNLKKPCENRGVNFIDNKDGSVSLDGIRFETMRECEDYLEGKARVDK
jgi:hypothetical protein